MSDHKPHVVRTKVMALPMGCRPGGSKAVRIAISFDDRQFEEINAYARAQGISYSAAVRELLDRSLGFTPTPAASGSKMVGA